VCVCVCVCVCVVVVVVVEEEEEEEGGITGNNPSALLCGRKVSYHLTHSTAFLL
jgi:preprotein translocase subunit SecG